MNIKATVTSLLVVAGLISPSAFAKSTSHARASSSHSRMGQAGKTKTAAKSKTHKTRASKSATARKGTKKSGRPVASSKARGSKARNPKVGQRKAKQPTKVGMRNHHRLSPKAVGKVQVPKGLAKQKKAAPMNQNPQS